MRVLVSLLSLTPASPSGTAFARSLLPELARELGGEENVTVLCDEPARALLASTPARFDVARVLDHRIARLLATRRLLPRAIERARPDVLYVPDGQLLGAPVRTPAVLAMHHALNFTRPEETSLPRRLYWKCYFDGAMRRDAARAVRLAADGAPALVAPTRAFARELEELMPEIAGRVAVAFHGVDPLFTPRDTVGSTATHRPDRFVLCVSNRFAYKNLAGAARIADRAFGDDPIELRVAGLDETEVTAVLDRHGVAASPRRRVRALGRLTPAELAQRYREASALLFPSLVESFGLPLVEAMASGCPIVASRLPAIEEVTAGAARLTDPGDEEGFARELLDVVSSGESRESLRRAGLERATAFSWRRAAGATAHVLQRAAGTPERGIQSEGA